MVHYSLLKLFAEYILVATPIPLAICCLSLLLPEDCIIAFTVPAAPPSPSLYTPALSLFSFGLSCPPHQLWLSASASSPASCFLESFTPAAATPPLLLICSSPGPSSVLSVGPSTSTQSVTHSQSALPSDAPSLVHFLPTPPQSTPFCFPTPAIYSNCSQPQSTPLPSVLYTAPPASLSAGLLNAAAAPSAP